MPPRMSSPKQEVPLLSFPSEVRARIFFSPLAFWCTRLTLNLINIIISSHGTLESVGETQPNCYITVSLKSDKELAGCLIEGLLWWNAAKVISSGLREFWVLGLLSAHWTAHWTTTTTPSTQQGKNTLRPLAQHCRPSNTESEQVEHLRSFRSTKVPVWSLAPQDMKV